MWFIWILLGAGATWGYLHRKHEAPRPAPPPPSPPQLAPAPTAPSAAPFKHSDMALTLSPSQVQAFGMKLVAFTEDDKVTPLAIQVFRDQETKANREAIRDEARRIGANEKVLQQAMDIAEGRGN